MYIANELKTTEELKFIDEIRNSFSQNLFEVIKLYFADKKMFSIDDFTLYYLDEYILNTNCNKDIFTTVYIDINQPLNYKTTKITKKNKKDKFIIPDLYLTLSEIKNGLQDTILKYFDSNNIVWQDKYSICIKSSVLIDDDTNQNYYFRIIPAFTHFNKDNVRGLVYYHNNEVQIEYPSQFIENFEKKNKKTKDKFRQVVLIMKNRLLKEKDITHLPSEIIETLVYNVPNNLITGDDKQSILKIVNFIRNNPLKSFRTIDEQDYAFSSIYRSMSMIYSKHILKIIEKYLIHN